MQYLKPSFTLPTVNKRMTQTEYEIAVGLRNSDGSLRRPKPKKVTRELFRRIPADCSIT